MLRCRRLSHSTIRRSGRYNRPLLRCVELLLNMIRLQLEGYPAQAQKFPPLQLLMRLHAIGDVFEESVALMRHIPADRVGARTVESIARSNSHGWAGSRLTTRAPDHLTIRAAEARASTLSTVRAIRRKQHDRAKHATRSNHHGGRFARINMSNGDALATTDINPKCIDT